MLGLYQLFACKSTKGRIETLGPFVSMLPTAQPKPSRVSVARAELYELVWSTPLRRVAKEFGISDVALAKRCRRMAIPLPEIEAILIRDLVESGIS